LYTPTPGRRDARDVRHYQRRVSQSETATGSRSRASTFFAKILNHEPQAFVNRYFFEDALTMKGIAHKCRGDEISKQFRVAQIGKIPIYFRGKLPWSVSFQVRIKLQHFRSQRFGFYGGGGFGFEGLYHCNREWRFLLKSAESDTFESLQNQVRRAVASFNTCANKTNAGNVKKVAGRIPFSAVRLEQCNAKHAVMGEGVL